MDCSVVPIPSPPITSGGTGGGGGAGGPSLSLISTTDFFYPLVDDPYVQGMVGACNVLSDMYALGVVNVQNMLMILASSDKMEPRSRDIVTRKMIEGFSDLCKSAGVEVTGGQTVMNPWPIIGGTAMSCCTDTEFIYPVNAEIGDVLVLTKPLGTQVAVNVNEWIQLENKTKWITSQEVITLEDARYAYQTSVDSMITLNRDAARLMHKHGAHAATDVTGFGIIGHATNLAKNQKVALDFVIHTLPIINKMELVDGLFPFFKLLKGFSSETSGGLLIALSRSNAEAFCRDFEALGGHFPSWIIGDVVSRDTTTSTIAAAPAPAPTTTTANPTISSKTTTTTTTTTTTDPSRNKALLSPSLNIVHV